MIGFAADTIEVVRPTFVKDHGRLIANVELPESETPVTGCSVQPGDGAELTANRQSTEALWTVYAPASIDVRSTDAVRWRGDLYAVDGQPARWSSPTGGLDHVVVKLKLWKEGP